MKSLLVDKNFSTVTEKGHTQVYLPEGVDLNSLRVMFEGEPKPYTIENPKQDFLPGAFVSVQVNGNPLEGVFKEQKGDWFTLFREGELIRVRGESMKLVGLAKPRLTFEDEAEIVYVHKGVQSDVFYQATLKDGDMNLSFWTTIHNRDPEMLKCQADVILNSLHRDSSELHSIPFLMVPGLSSRCFCLWSEKFKVHSVVNIPLSTAGEVKSEMYVAGIAPRYFIPGSLTYISKYFSRESNMPSVLQGKTFTISLGSTDTVKGELKIDKHQYNLELTNRTMDRLNVDVTLPLEGKFVHQVKLSHLAKTKYTTSGNVLHVIFPFIGSAQLMILLGDEPAPPVPEEPQASDDSNATSSTPSPETPIKEPIPEMTSEVKLNNTEEDSWITVQSRKKRK